MKVLFIAIAAVIAAIWIKNRSTAMQTTRTIYNPANVQPVTTFAPSNAPPPWTGGSTILPPRVSQFPIASYNPASYNPGSSYLPPAPLPPAPASAAPVTATPNAGVSGPSVITGSLTQPTVNLGRVVSPTPTNNIVIGGILRPIPIDIPIYDTAYNRFSSL